LISENWQVRALARFAAPTPGTRGLTYTCDVAQLVDLLARNLGISKTAAVRMMEAGRVCDARENPYRDRKAVMVDGESAVDPPTVIVDGEPVVLWHTAVILLHKPVGVVTALRDARHPTAYDLLREAPLFPELRPAGRLDLDTSGLLLWTTEGALIQRLTHPKRRVPRTYHAALAHPYRAPSPDLVLQDGHRPDLLELRPISRQEAHPSLVIPPGTVALATVTVVGGAYHEIRRLFVALGSHVLGLCRTRFGDVQLPHDLPAGAWRHLPDS
jgi:16S rRNA pseudouridine516 synthase